MFPPAVARHRLVGAVAALLIVGGLAASAGSTTAAPTPRVASNGQTGLYLLGDSLTVGSVAFGRLQERLGALGLWTRVGIDAKVGRTASAAVAVLTARLARRPAVSAIVIAVGTNDMIIHDERSYPRAAIDRIMRASKGRPVLWVNVEFGPAAQANWRRNAVRFNTALVAAAARWPNLSVADWNTYFRPAKGYSAVSARFVADGVHLTPRGYRLRSAWLARRVAAFGRTIVDATTTTTSSTSTSTTSTTTPPSTSTPTTSTTTTSTTPDL